MSSNPTPRLGPTWRSNNSGRGFAPPPPAVPDNNNNSNAEAASPSANRNSFSLLDLDDNSLTGDTTLDDFTTVTGKDNKSSSNNTGGGNVNESSYSKKIMSRSEGLRSTGTGSGGFSTGSRASKLNKGGGGTTTSTSTGSGGTNTASATTGSSGRSLADLASRFTSASSSSDRDLHHRDRTTNTSHSSGGVGERGGGLRHHHRHHYDDNTNTNNSSSNNMITSTSSTGNGRLSTKNAELMEQEHSVIRLTRERLLSMRPNVRPGDYENECKKKEEEGGSSSILMSLAVLEGTALFSKEPLDPGKYKKSKEDLILEVIGDFVILLLLLIHLYSGTHISYFFIFQPCKS